MIIYTVFSGYAVIVTYIKMYAVLRLCCQSLKVITSILNYILYLPLWFSSDLARTYL
jgi:hypothetical protein